MASDTEKSSPQVAVQDFEGWQGALALVKVRTGQPNIIVSQAARRKVYVGDDIILPSTRPGWFVRLTIR